ncbi:16S rRNA (uracil(1498)-N(3))-methyltransferase [Methylovulum psychrotolerans]|jgi:16S rRNA (uracil1498-N3)-methyltransferase|uniref:Ribosomal RNA small subunit methyltransferase E n=1 Tax=Methylovulum psychrotolerans TaxID=1704499 RepID=A0A2S5CT92_9GAMM|nr:16S rRNA (uracil(1498)-N(3))-methyltransferase [Methylovulum psychrotolerans]MBT9098231.1 16S rRNA (uracil(1498)-N(3))-methyltransferase [Methylovulum psychrotolerans]POZ53942.1 16S rRNA (uracil(1498)-N(3))-methyltransferase [Methylovulum psychrotolerans]
MRVSRLYTALPLAQGDTIDLDDDSGHYLRTVLRLKKADELILFNGDGGEYLARVEEVGRKAVAVAIGARQERSVESPLQVNLGLGIARGDRMDWSVQKAVELGVNRITPLMTERCVVQFKGEKKPQRLLHWQKIVQHAAEQSGRTVVPALTEIAPLASWVGQQQGLRVFLDPYAQTSLAQLQPEAMQVTLLTGPEGGFSAQEREIAQAAGFIPVRLGSRILRTETASLTALAAVQMLWGDFK